MKLSNKLLIACAFFAIYIIWGTTYLVIVIGLQGFQPFFMASLRFVIAGVLLVGYAMWKGEQVPPGASILKNTFIGLVVLCGGQGLLIWSEQYIASGYASVLVATLPLWFVILDRRHWKLYFSNPYIILGVLLGFVGIIVLFRERLADPVPGENVELQLLASALVLIGAMCWVTGTLYNRSRPAPGSIFHNLGWQLLTSSVLCLIISVLLGEWEETPFRDTTWNAWSAVVYLSVAGSILAFVAYTWLLNKMPSAIVGTYAYVNPVVAVFLGWLWAGEVITADQMTGMVIILVSAVLVNLNRTKAAKKANPG